MGAFPNSTEKDPVALCKKLRRIETAVHRPILNYCNGDGGVTEPGLTVEIVKAMGRVKLLFGLNDSTKCGLFANLDPRGHALKLDAEWTRKFNDAQYQAGKPAIHTDMAGNGILAPDLTA